jgi:CheY-like chemotaxis protein
MGDFPCSKITYNIQTKLMGARSYFLLGDEIFSTDQIEGKSNAQKSEDQLILAKKSILVIDDNPINLSVAEKTLHKFGAEALTSFSAKEGIQTFTSNTVDLILMDLHMPVIDGFEATQMIRATSAFQDRPVPILAYTTYSYNEVKDAIVKFELDGYIGKPFTQTQVLETILSVLK